MGKDMYAMRAGLPVICIFGLAAAFAAEPPAISGTPAVDTAQILLWPNDQGEVKPNLNNPDSNVLFDFHGELNECDFVLSSEGNYHPALHDIWPVFLAKFKDTPLKNAFYSTSPPVFTEQTRNGVLQFGNLYVKCRPQLAAGGIEEIKKLQEAQLTEGEPIPFYEDRGEVILVKKGNPKHIKTVWDLARADVHYVSPNPDKEPGAFKNYASTIYGIAMKDPHPPAGKSAEKLITAIFDARKIQDKWLAGTRIHHRDIPWSIAYGKADAGIIIYHLGRFTQQTFPEQFDIVPLGGNADNPQPLSGTVTSVRYVVKVKGEWNSRQREAAQTFIDTLLSDDFTAILQKRGLKRPADFEKMKAQ